MEKNIEKLTGKDISRIKAYSQQLDYYFMIGKNGLTDSVLKKLDEELENHEVIKIKFQKNKDMVKEFAEIISLKTQSKIIKIIGFSIVLYRRSKKSDNHVI